MGAQAIVYAAKLHVALERINLHDIELDTTWGIG